MQNCSDGTRKETEKQGDCIIFPTEANQPWLSYCKGWLKRQPLQARRPPLSGASMTGSSLGGTEGPQRGLTLPP